MKLCICICYDNKTGIYEDICKCNHRKHNGYCLSKYILENRKISHKYYNTHRSNKFKLNMLCLK